MIRALASLILAIALVLPQSADAYGFYAHGRISRLAMLNVKPQTRAAVMAMLRQQALIETPECRVDSVEEAGAWADCARGLGARFQYTASWHYQNVDVCKPFDLASACKDGNCVSAQVDRNVKLLQDRATPRREKIMALLFLMHFVEDLHMPLHAGDRADRGGNDVRSSYGDYVSERLNLHSIWDGALAERAITTPPEIIRPYSPRERAALSGGTTLDWSREAWAVSRDVAYAGALGDPCGAKPDGRVTLTSEAIAAAVPAAQLQAQRAGLRLARLLDESFDPANAFDSAAQRRERRRPRD
ncbi:S1/P1 nuclease [Sphingomonas sp. BGYR3]|uniref:S1/P1 nuclease n=1 Tax=Sphingomonas sp. BGYR3 TaxID=2975483 RepID=UPI0021A6A7B1|nr:S1/P1 nuclease [Sphingomonas sp. BGYR3]MDG5488741.1 S1/P1 nuclease [Sphingomonas sp. BGYR3]